MLKCHLYWSGWWHMPLHPALRRLRQEDLEFKGNIARLCLKIKRK
jgi:hypothetical protein